MSSEARKGKVVIRPYDWYRVESRNEKYGGFPQL